MINTGTKLNPLTTFSGSDAAEHWRNGNGADVFMSMSAHLKQAGSVFSMQDFGTKIRNITDGLAVNSVVVFESNKDFANLIGAERIVESHSIYLSHGILSEDAFIWGITSASFRAQPEIY